MTRTTTASRSRDLPEQVILQLEKEEERVRRTVDALNMSSGSFCHEALQGMSRNAYLFGAVNQSTGYYAVHNGQRRYFVMSWSGQRLDPSIVERISGVHNAASYVGATEYSFRKEGLTAIAGPRGTLIFPIARLNELRREYRHEA